MKDKVPTPCSYEKDQSPTIPSMTAANTSVSLGQQHHQPTVDDIRTPAQPIPSMQAHVPATSCPSDVKHGKARMHADELSLAHVRQCVRMRGVSFSRLSAGGSKSSSSGMDEHDGPRSSKRRRLSAERQQNAWEGAEDVRMLNKAFRAAEDALQARDAENALLREELMRTKRDYERKESELRQDLLFRHILAREQAQRDHEKEKISLRRLVSFLKTDHEKYIEQLRDEYRNGLAREHARTKDAVADSVKLAQLARLREVETEAHLQRMHEATEHAGALANLYESDLAELQRLAIEECEERDRNNLGLPPAYDSLQDIKGYRTPYGATRHRDAGDLDLNNIHATVTDKFMIELNAANRASLALRQNPDPKKAAGAGLLLYHRVMMVFAGSCHRLRDLLEQAIEKAAGTAKSQSLTERTPSLYNLPPRLSAMLPLPRSRTPTKLPSLSDLGLLSTQEGDAPGPDRSHRHAQTSVSELAIAQATIAATDEVSRTLYELCNHMLAALEVREQCPHRLWPNWCAHTGVWLYLADTTLLQFLRRRLEATVVEQHQPQDGSPDVTLSCSACGSENCSGYCSRLHMLSYNINILKAIRRGFDRISSPTRAGMFFHATWEWLKETLESERQIAANTFIPPALRSTPEMTGEEMALTIQHSAMEPDTAAAQQVLRRQDSEAESEAEPARGSQAGPGVHLHSLDPPRMWFPPARPRQFHPPHRLPRFPPSVRPGHMSWDETRASHIRGPSSSGVPATEEEVEDMMATLDENFMPALRDARDVGSAGPSSSGTSSAGLSSSGTG